jgi:hypothetical protein
MAGLWTPRASARGELLRIEEATNQALDALLLQHVPGYSPPRLDRPSGDLEAIRERMARGHRLRVDRLLNEIGREEGIRLGRAALHPVGLMLGGEARARLGVGDGAKDLERAAKVVYRILGIEIEMELSEGGGRMRVRRCSLSPHYSQDTCAVLSATDEGMVSGLSPRARMEFVEHITSGSSGCLARIQIEGG